MWPDPGPWSLLPFFGVNFSKKCKFKAKYFSRPWVSQLYHCIYSILRSWGSNKTKTSLCRLGPFEILALENGQNAFFAFFRTIISSRPWVAQTSFFIFLQFIITLNYNKNQKVVQPRALADMSPQKSKKFKNSLFCCRAQNFNGPLRPKKWKSDFFLLDFFFWVQRVQHIKILRNSEMVTSRVGWFLQTMALNE